MPVPSLSRLRFVPDLARSVGFLPVASLPKGAFVITPSRACHSHSTPSISSYSASPTCHNRSKKPALSHSWKRSWTVELWLPIGCRCEVVRRSSPRERFSLRHASPAASGVRGGGRNQRLHLLPKLLAHRPGLVVRAIIASHATCPSADLTHYHGFRIRT